MGIIEDIHKRSIVSVKGRLKNSSKMVELGSGVIIHEEGYLVTTYQVVKNARDFKRRSYRKL